VGGRPTTGEMSLDLGIKGQIRKRKKTDEVANEARGHRERKAAPLNCESMRGKRSLGGEARLIVIPERDQRETENIKKNSCHLINGAEDP